MTFIALIANGEIQDYPFTAGRLKNAGQIIAVDGGLNHCDQMGITPDLLIGDLDSCPPDLLQRYPNLPTQKFPFDKDETDLEIALKYIIDNSPLPIHIFGALKKRLDHTLYNLQLLARYPNRVIIENHCETIFSLSGRTTLATLAGQVISLIPINGPAIGVSTKGLKWELSQAVLDQNFMSISNIALGEKTEVTVSQGNLLIISH